MCIGNFQELYWHVEYLTSACCRHVGRLVVFGLGIWCLKTLYGLLLQVAPKRAALAAAQATLDATLAELASAQSSLAAVQEKIAALEAQFEEATAKKSALAAQVSQHWGAQAKVHAVK